MGTKHGFSWKRAMGISAAKSRLSRRIGIPLTQSGRRRKFGKWGLRPFFSPAFQSRRVSMPMGHGYCPACGVKFNVRASSIGTVKRCPACGHKFVLERAPARYGCLPATLGFLGFCVLIYALFQIPWTALTLNSAGSSPPFAANPPASASPPSKNPAPQPSSQLAELEKARVACVASLKKTQTYIDASEDTKAKLAHLNDARGTGDTDEIPRASDDYQNALAKLKQMEDDAYKNDPAVLAAEKLVRDSATTAP